MGSSFSLTNLNGNHFHHICNKIYIGDYYSTYDNFFIKQKKLVVINATKDVKFNRNLKSINYRLPVHDDLRNNSIKFLYMVLDNFVDVIDKHIKEGYTILVHCMAGRQRSCSIVAGYLMKYKNMDLDTAIEFIKTKRAFAFLGNINFYKALYNYEKDLEFKKVYKK